MLNKMKQPQRGQIQLGHLADAFIQSDLHRLIHTLTHQPRQPARQEQLG
jgi:hypothetical protein